MAPTAQICAPRRGVGSVALTLGKSVFFSAWYTVVTAPDANAFLHRALNSHTGQPVVRFLDGTRSILQFATLPIAAIAALLGRTRITRISSFLVFANPPTLLLSALIAHDMANFIFKQVRKTANTILRYSPFPTGRRPQPATIEGAAPTTITPTTSPTSVGTSTTAAGAGASSTTKS